RELILRGFERRIMETTPEVDGTRVAEAATGNSSSRIERDDASVDRAEVDSPATGVVARRARVEPRRHATIGEVAPVAVAVDVGVVRPARRAALRIERDDAPEGS